MSSRKVPTPSDIGRNIKKYRNIRGFSQRDLGRLAYDLLAADWSRGQQRISELETGTKKYPTIVDVYLIAKALKVKVGDLLKIE